MKVKSFFRGYSLKTLLIIFGLCILYSSGLLTFTHNDKAKRDEPAIDYSTKLGNKDRQSNGQSSEVDHYKSSERSQVSAVNTTHKGADNIINADYEFLDVAENDQRIFYNRVPKCGSSVTGGVISQLSKRNKFTYSKSRITDERKVNVGVQKEQCRHVSTLTAPALYNRHLFYVDCTKFGYPALVYINLIRDPAERYISWYSFHRSGFNFSKQAKPEKYFLKTLDKHLATEEVTTSQKFHVISYFCGQDDFCSDPRTKEEMDRSLSQAKEHIRQSFPVIGVHEDMSTFFRVLEKRFPRFFSTALNSYTSITEAFSERFSSKRKENVQEKSRSILASELSYEYDLYNFVKQRFYQQAKRLGVIQ